MRSALASCGPCRQRELSCRVCSAGQWIPSRCQATRAAQAHGQRGHHRAVPLHLLRKMQGLAYASAATGRQVCAQTEPLHVGDNNSGRYVSWMCGGSVSLGTTYIRDNSAAGLAHVRQPVPREWSVLRPWDGRDAASRSPPRPVPADASEPLEGSAQNGGPQLRRALRRSAPSPLGGITEIGAGHGGPQRRSAAQSSASPLPPSSCTRSRARQLELRSQPVATEMTDHAAGRASWVGSGPVSGSVAVSSVDPELLELLRVAVRRLRGLRLCEDGSEEARLTHLVLGAQRRTLKASHHPHSNAHAQPTFRQQHHVSRAGAAWRSARTAVHERTAIYPSAGRCLLIPMAYCHVGLSHKGLIPAREVLLFDGSMHS